MRFFFRNIWNTEEDILATYKNIFKQKKSFLTPFSFTNQTIFEQKARKFWALGEGYGQWDLYLNTTQRDYFEQDIVGWKANYFASDVFASFLRDNFRSTECWGVDIGKPYYAISSHLSPISVKNLVYLLVLLKKARAADWRENQPENHTPFWVNYAGVRKREKMTLYQIGNSDAFRKAYAFLYKFGIREEHLDMTAFDFTGHLSQEHLDDYLKILDYSRLSRLLMSLDAQSTNQERMLERIARWDRLALLRRKKYEDQKKKWGILTLIIKIIIFLRNYNKTIKKHLKR